ncbi:MAG: glycosyltransferase [Bacteroidaceae bacterium]|nr:glycosyltransferase [Bacteroidaceae bacterium]
MKNILFFIESLSGGGAEKVLVTLLNHLDKSKYCITLLTLVDTGVLKKDVDFSQITYRTIIKQSNHPILRWWYKVKYKLLYQYLPASLVNKWIIPQKGIDTYIAFTEGYCTKILAHTSKNKIAWVHCNLKELPWTTDGHIYQNKEQEIIAFTKYDKVVTVSKDVQAVMVSDYFLRNVITLYNPIDTQHIQNLSNESNSYEIKNGSFKIVSVGRLVPAKGYDLLIPIVSKLTQKGLDIHLYLLGEGNERNRLEQIIQEENMSNHIHLLGYVKNPYPIMKQMNLFVCSSRSEGYSLVIAEALTLGLPVISMDCSGPNELLDNGKYGILCNNYDDLYQVLNSVITDKNYYLDLKEKAAKRKDFFDIHTTMKQIEQLLSE